VAESQPAQWHDARRLAYDAGSPLPLEQVALADAVGRVLADDMTALIDVPHYASSAMDGWAVSGDPPWSLIKAGPLRAGEATRIVTGGLVPDGARAVLRSESGEETYSAGSMLVAPTASASPDEPRDGMHIRPVGEEAHAGERVCRAGVTLNPAHIAVAAVCGHDELSVAPRPRVSLIFTGDEVVTSGIPAPGHVRDSFGPQLHSLIGMLGAHTSSQQRLPDRLDRFVATLEPKPDGVMRPDVIVTTGGTGHSPADHLHDALDAVRARVLIDGIVMRPGGPTLLARLQDGSFVVGLPGNPLAAMMGVFTVLQPLLAALRGVPVPTLGRVAVGHDLAGGRGRIRLIPYLIEDGVAVTSAWHGSGMLRGLADAHGVLLCPASGASAGDQVQTLPLPWITTVTDNEMGHTQ